MNIKLIRLLNGEEIIAKIMPSTNDIVRMENPIRIVVMPNKIDPKTPNVGFAPWVEFSDDKIFEVQKSHVLCIINPIKEFINQYNSMFGGLVLPPSGLIK